MNITDFYSPNRGPIATPGEPGQVKPGAGLTVSPDGTLSVVTDSALSPDSSNPIQNGAVDAALKAKLDSPAGGTAGQVLTKTASGAEWKPAISDYVKSVNGMRGEVTLAVPEQVSDLPNDAGYQTAGEVTAAVSVKADKTALAAHAGDAGIHVTADDKAAWNAKADAASVPRKVSDLPNDAGYQTGDQVAAAVADKAAVSALAAHAGNAVIHVTAEQKSAWDAKADASSVITDTSKLRNDAGFQTKGEVDAAVAGKLDSPAAAGSAGDVLVREGSSQVWKPVSGMGIKSSELVNDSQFQTKGEVEAAVGAKMDDPGAGAPGEVLTMVDGAPAWQSVPRATVKSSELDNDLKFQTEAQLTAALSGKADVQSLAAHAADPVLHVTAEERSAWNAKADRSEIGDEAMRAIAGAGYVTGPEVDAKVSAKANAAELTGHVNDDGIHVSPAKKAEWDGKADKADIIRDTANLTNGAGFQTAADVNSLLSTRMPKPDNDLTAPVGFVLVKSGDDTTEWRKSEGGGSAAIPQVQADWNETSEASKAFIRNKPAIPTVNDGTVTLTQGGVPKGSFTLNQAEPVTIDLDAGGTGGVEQVQADWNEVSSSSKAFIRNKPALATVATTGSYRDLTDQSELALKTDLDAKVNSPQGNGVAGQVLKSNGDGTTVWSDGGTGAVSDMHGIAVEVLRELPSWSEQDDGRVFQWHGTGDPNLVPGNIYRVEKKTKTVSTPNRNVIVVDAETSDPMKKYIVGEYTLDEEKSKYQGSKKALFFYENGRYFFKGGQVSIEIKTDGKGTSNPIDVEHANRYNQGFNNGNPSGKEWTFSYSNPMTTETVTAYELVLFNPASSGGASGTQVSHLQLVKASNALHLEVRVAGSDGSFASATPLVNTADGTGIGKLRAYSETGEGGVWDEVTADGLSESYDGNPVSIDMTGVAVPSIVYYCWISAEGMRSPWHSTVFPSSGESSNHDSGIDQILAGKMDKPSTDGTAGQVLKSNGDGTASWSDAGSVDLSAHAENHDIHVTAEDKVKWNAKQDAITGSSKLQASLIDGLAAVATTGSYNSLSERPDIPAVNDTLVMVNQGGVLKRRFTLNQSEPVTIDLDAGGGGSVSVDSGSNTILNGTDGLKVNIDKVVTANNISYDSISAGSFYSLKAVEKFDMEHHGPPGFTFELASASSGASQVTVHPRGFDGSTGDVIVSDGFHPVIGVRTSKGNFYTVESGDCKFIEGYTRLNIWRYLAYDNASGMGSEWTAYLIG